MPSARSSTAPTADVAFVDANVPIYAAGRPHELKTACLRVLALIERHPARFVTDAEVLQELLHRYRAVGLWPLGRTVVASFAVLMEGRVEAMQASDVLAAAALADQHPALRARDLVHVALAGRIGVSWVVSADRHFDRLVGIERLDPAGIGDWQERFAG